VQSKNTKGNQQTEEKRKYKNKKGKGDNKDTNNFGEGKIEKRKVNFLCNLCMNDHLTHQCHQLEEAQNLLAQQQPSMLTNPFPQGKKLAQASSSMNANGRTQGDPTPNDKNRSTNVYMTKSDAHLQTRDINYKIP
jgi:hypothetical protein